ncbi:hypothetical protein ACRARG_14065 [Pseudooceanicola sp. C21-150M6]|uniref:hypothetical protein n=1 Tax=Pseudooceanicola sp. C21-150M6 TaxID=3434355 RepID=UPI003D7F4F3B
MQRNGAEISGPEAAGILTVKLIVALTDAERASLLSRAEQQLFAGRALSLLLDLSEQRSTRMTSDSARQLLIHCNACIESMRQDIGPRFRIALHAVPDSYGQGIARMIEANAYGLPRIAVRIFDNVNIARSWLHGDAADDHQS